MHRRWFWTLPFFVLFLAAAGFVGWAGSAAAPLPEALAALQFDATVTVNGDPWLVLAPSGQQPSTGLILYPGGRVDPPAYVPAARAIAAAGYRVVVVPMPLNLAVLDPGAASEVIAAFPEVEHWAIGGHSLGGAMAASFAHANPQAVRGLVLWAAYPTASDDLSTYDLAVTSIYGTLDGLTTGDDIDASRPLLPADTHWVAIDGGNHAQFGWYGDQNGDNPATISRDSQQQQVVEATAALLEEIAE